MGATSRFIGTWIQLANKVIVCSVNMRRNCQFLRRKIIAVKAQLKHWICGRFNSKTEERIKSHNISTKFIESLQFAITHTHTNCIHTKNLFYENSWKIRLNMIKEQANYENGTKFHRIIKCWAEVTSTFGILKGANCTLKSFILSFARAIALSTLFVMHTFTMLLTKSWFMSSRHSLSCNSPIDLNITFRIHKNWLLKSSFFVIVARHFSNTFLLSSHLGQ